MTHTRGRMRGWVVAAIVFFLGVALPACPASAWPVHVGVLGGIGLSKLRGPHSPVIELGEVKSACYGATVSIPIGARWWLQPGVLVVTDGILYGKFERSDVYGNLLGTFELLHVLDRLQFPVLVRLASPNPGPLRPFVFAGPYAATRLREYDRATGSFTSTVTDPALKRAELGVTMGGGAQWKLRTGQLELQGRYDTGLTNLGVFRDLGTTARTGALRFLAGYSY